MTPFASFEAWLDNEIDCTATQLPDFDAAMLYALACGIRKANAVYRKITRDRLYDEIVSWHEEIFQEIEKIFADAIRQGAPRKFSVWADAVVSVFSAWIAEGHKFMPRPDEIVQGIRSRALSLIPAREGDSGMHTPGIGQATWQKFMARKAQVINFSEHRDVVNG